MNRTFLIKAILILLLISLNFNYTYSQSEGQRLSFGFNAGGVKYWGEFTDNQFWLGGDLFLRYNIIPQLSLTGSFGLAQMRWKVDAAALNKYPGYFGENAQPGDRYPGVDPITGATIQPKNQTRLNTYELTASYNFFPSQKFVPYVFGGIGYLDFEPRAGDVGGFGPLPNNSKEIYDKQLLIIPVGAGFEFYLTDDLVFNGRATLRITNTDYLDDLAGKQESGSNWDANADEANDLFMTFGLGFSYYILGDADYDNDGLSNSRERELGTDPYNPDSDGDGLKDGEEVYIYYTDPLKPDTDGDGLTDYDEIFTYKTSPVKSDTDSDGLNDGEEVARKTDPNNPDTDGDGLLDGDEVNKHQTDPLNPDTDSDGLSDGDEVMKYNTNPKAKDTDGDGLDDGDEINKYKTNPTNPDTDGDGLNDGAEILTHKTDPLKPDTDGDGLSDGDEVLTHKTDPLNKDTDGDGLSDGDEVHKYKTNPLNEDTDMDGLKDGDEVNKYKTDPLNKDTDGDGLSDGEEVLKYKTDPLNRDTDNDKLTDGKEVFETKTDPLNPDTDGDGIIDGEDDCPLTPGVPSEEKGSHGCPPAPKIGTKTDFPDILFIVNTDDFNYDYEGTAQSLAKLLDYVNQCPGLQIRVEGHASAEGNAKRNQQLSELRAKKVRTWLIEQGVNGDRIRGAIGFGSKQQKIQEPTGQALKSIAADELEAIRKQNRRITVEVVRTCDEVK
ncbi:MAG: OmpA family protein [Candidatus Kapabacteria bacterium]|nr:OmpA family protein [Ignavibacteriota bacterium]MCW5885447.1 OmpA family protein [Candidatus Kapabacteria bacterium]